MARTDTLGHFLTDVADAIRTKGGTSATIQASSFDTAIANLPSGGTEIPPSDVNFYDYDGTITNAYTKTQFLALTAMPSNPTHSGLTSQGWNWSLSDAQTFVASAGMLDIGQMYKTSDDATKIFVTLSNEHKSPYVGLAVNGTATIDWGDNSSTSTLTGTDTTTVVSVQHVYSSAGDYVISISSESEYHLIGDNSNDYSMVVWNNETSSAGSAYMSNCVYNWSITDVFIGKNVVVDSYAFRNCPNIKTFLITNNSISLYGTYILYFNKKIKHITIPTSVTSLPSNFICGINCTSLSIHNSITAWNAYFVTSGTLTLKRICITGNFSSSQALQSAQIKEIAISPTFTQLKSSMFRYNYQIEKIKLPKSIATISSYSLSGDPALVLVDCRDFENVPTVTTNSFQNCSSNLKIVVPDSLYSTWITTSNWSTWSSYVVKESDYNG